MSERTIYVEWWRDEASHAPMIGVQLNGTEYPLTRAEAVALRDQITACLNGIVFDLARYLIVKGWGAKEHLAFKAGYTKTATAICGRKPHRLGDGEPWEWRSWPLQGEPRGRDLCQRCRAKYDRLEATP